MQVWILCFLPGLPRYNSHTAKAAHWQLVYSTVATTTTKKQILSIATEWLVPFTVSFLLSPLPQETSTLFLIRIVLAFLECHTSKIIQYLVFGVQLPVLNIMFLRSIHELDRSDFYSFIFSCHSIVWMYHSLFTHSSPDARLFPVWGHCNLLQIFTCKSVWMFSRSFLTQQSGSFNQKL